MTAGDGVASEWPALPYADWQATRDTLHMYTQVIGKLRLALSPFEPGWANVPLYVTARGLTTSPVPIGLRSFDAELDLHDHALVLRTDDGRVERRPLGGAVADFYGDVMDALRRMQIDVSISVLPSEVPDPIPFPEDRTHATYDPAQVERFHRTLSIVDLVMKEHRAQFRGRTSPVHFFWGTFDLALTRYSGRLVEPLKVPNPIMHFGTDAELICAGWWPGDHRLASPRSSPTHSRRHPASTRCRSGHPRRPGARMRESFSSRTTRRLHPPIHAVPFVTFSPPLMTARRR